MVANHLALFLQGCAIGLKALKPKSSNVGGVVCIDKGAIETAEKSKALALKDKDDAYVKNNDKLIAEAKAMK